MAVHRTAERRMIREANEQMIRGAVPTPHIDADDADRSLKPVSDAVNEDWKSAAQDKDGKPVDLPRSEAAQVNW